MVVAVEPKLKTAAVQSRPQNCHREKRERAERKTENSFQSLQAKMKLHIVFLGLVALLLVATVYAAPRKPQWARQFSSPFGLNICTFYCRLIAALVMAPCLTTVVNLT